MSSLEHHRVAHDEVDLDVVVDRIDESAEGVRAFTLRRPDGAPLPPWAAGAHVDVFVGGHVRQYSLCGDPGDRESWRIAVLREKESRGGSTAMHALAVGDPLHLRGPRNNFPLEPAARYLFVAGGIGITPILPMIAAAEAARTPWTAVVGGRSRAAMALVGELDRHGDKVRLVPQDEAGMLDLDGIVSEAGSDGAVYCCGPEGLLTAMEERCRPAGVELHVERFAPKVDTDALPSDSFEVELASSGKVLTVPADRSILEVLEADGVQILSSCREGTCGTCETEVLEGEVDHRDSLLTPQEQAANDVMFVCVSRAACPRLVLDL